ncbi:MAG TPA: protein kinase [Polyangiaceae bacterium]|nr:protein kinase [Polyangiaceae bacterium]
MIDQRFRVLSLIGSGGMADVYEVEHVTLGRRLALKLLRHTEQSNAAVTRRFSREARALSRITSEHVVSIFDHGVLPGGFPYFVMELLRGRTLRAALDEEHQLTAARTSNLGIDVCLGLAAAHQAGLIHRDLKPENLWLTRRDDGREACILLDFGVAQVEGAHTTSDGVLVGTARYMSPEQVRSDGEAGPESDVFALGIVLYECLCGAAPFAADTLERTLFRIVNEPPSPIGERAADTPQELAEVLGRALSKQRGDRFASAMDMARALLPFAGPHRQLPGLHLEPRTAGANDTLPDDEAQSPLLAGLEHDAPLVEPARQLRPALRWAFLALAFLSGLAAGALLLRKAPAAVAVERPATTISVPLVGVQSATPSEAPPAPGVSTPSSDAPTVERALPTDTPARRSRPPLLAKPIASPPASAPPQADRPTHEPPQPSFDGRNPYRP